MFQITAPVDSFDKVKFFEQLWVIDYYAGGWTVYDWGEKYDYMTYINGRSGKEGNFLTMEEFRDTIVYCKEKWLQLALTFNHLPAIADHKVLFDEIGNINKNLNPENIIIFDFLSGQFFDADKKLYISNQAAIYDEDTFKEWRKAYPNIQRIIFPRDVLLETLEWFFNDKDLRNNDIEIFIKNEWCYHTTSCTSMHGVWVKHGIPFLCHREDKMQYQESEIAKKIKPLLEAKNQCKMCFLHKVHTLKKKTGYNKDVFLKLVGRTKTKKQIAKDILFIRFAIEVLQKNEDVDYKKYVFWNIAAHQKIYGEKCEYQKCEYYQEAINS